MTSPSPWAGPGRPDPLVQRLARAVAMAFLVVGVLGFLPGATSHLSQMAVAGPGSPAVLLGLLPVTALGNLAHVLLGLAGLASSGTTTRARRFLLWGGVAYAVLCLRSIAVGAASPVEHPGALVPLWVAAAAGVVLVGAAWLASPPHEPPTARRHGFRGRATG